MREIYECSGTSPNGMKIREYYESATQVGSIDITQWAVSPSMTSGFKDKSLHLTVGIAGMGHEDQDVHVV